MPERALEVGSCIVASDTLGAPRDLAISTTDEGARVIEAQGRKTDRDEVFLELTKSVCPMCMRAKLDVLERGSDMVLAAHFTPLGSRLSVTTVETIRFERPERVAFRLLRGPVPHLTETFELRPVDDGTELAYRGELGTDLWRLGSWWGALVARPWERTVTESLSGVRTEAERRAGVRETR